MSHDSPVNVDATSVCVDKAY